MPARWFASILLAGLSPLAAFGRPSNSLLGGGDEAVLAPPVASFRDELSRMKLPSPEFPAVSRAKYQYSFDTAEMNGIAEVDDLRTALAKAGTSPAEIDRIATNHLAGRKKLMTFVGSVEGWKLSGHWDIDGNGGSRWHSSDPPPFPRIGLTAGLPGEFADYFEAAMAWHNPAVSDKDIARQAWERILNRPPDERRFKSTWAAFMLGRSWEKENPAKAIAYYNKVRALTKAGLTDTLGLAEASLGREARIRLDEPNYESAIELYLQQMAAGDESALPSLREVMRTIVRRNADQFPALVKNPRSLRVVTAYIISTRALQSSPAGVAAPTRAVNDWLAAAEAAEVHDPEAAEELALAAYQNEDLETAQRWIDRAHASPVAQWLQARLLFHAGKMDQGGAQLTKVARMFPKALVRTNMPTGLKDCLTVPMSDNGGYGISPADHICGELGVFHFGRGEYTVALDYFLRACFWEDAAYVAERVLTVDELKSYVDRRWPAWSALQRDPQGNRLESIVDLSPRQELRHLLARRLTRVLRGNEARDYYPEPLHPQFDMLAQALITGWNESLPAEKRAPALFTAAWIARTNGMDLFGTEVGPDWRIYGGSYEGTLSASSRTNGNFTLFPASPDELRRDSQHRPDPDVRFHYRYQAAFLAWEAAKLLPNNSDETARVLWTAGSWLKDRDPQTADIFYKSLVRRCRETALGAEADRVHWFPRLDDSGNVIPRPSRTADTTPATAVENEDPPDSIAGRYPAPGKSYVIQAGDLLDDIAQAASVWGRPITVQEILEANPGLDGATLLVGQAIVIPKMDRSEAPQ